MVALRALMRERYAGWRRDLPEAAGGQAEPGWRTFFAGCPAPNFAAIPEALEVANVTCVWPGRRADPLPGAPEGAHICRAFDRMQPRDVRVVVLGQDPYPSVDRATGRAFEDGAWDGTEPETAANSLRRLLQSAAVCASPNLGISEEEDDWIAVWDAIYAGDLAPPAMPKYFDDLAAQGVLCINAAWTFTGRTRAHLDVHLRVWRPIVQHLILGMITREGGGPVFLQLGGRARTLFRAATWRHLRANPEINVRTVYCAHPTAWTGQTYFDYGNPLTRTNQTLAEVGDVRWWPDLPRAEA